MHDIKFKKLLLITDSMAMPRPELRYEETWPYLLAYDYPDLYIIDKSRRASTTNRLVKEGDVKNLTGGCDLLEFYMPDYVIIQIGITDCAPRYFDRNKLYTKILFRVPSFISNGIQNYKRKYSYRKPCNCDVKIEKFETNIRNYLTRAKNLNIKVFFITIAPAPEKFIEKNPYIENQITKYNGVLEKLKLEYLNFELIDSLTIDEMERFAIDEFHIGREGQKVQYQKIKLAIDEIIKDAIKNK